MSTRTIIIGGGPAGRAAAALLPGAAVLSRPEVTVFHAEPAAAGWRLWLLQAEEIHSVEAERVVLAAPDLPLAMAFGAAVADGRPVVDRIGRTGAAGVWACGALLGAPDAETAGRQGRIVVADIRGAASEGSIEPIAAAAPAVLCEDEIVCPCLGLTRGELRTAGPLTAPELANLFHIRAGECRMRRCGRHLGAPFRVVPARPVPIAALARLAKESPAPRPLQPADGELR